MQQALHSAPSADIARELLAQAINVEETLRMLLDQVHAMLARAQQLSQELDQRRKSTASAHGLLFVNRCTGYGEL